MTAIECDDGIDEAHWGRLLGRRAKRCHVCSRSIWECDREGGPDCLTAAKEGSMPGLIARTIAAERLDTALAHAVCLVVDRLRVAASPCSDADHVAAMSRRPSSLEYRGLDGDVVTLECRRCKAPVTMTREQALNASAPIEMATARQRRRRETPVTAVMPAMTIAEAAAEMHARLGGGR